MSQFARKRFGQNFLVDEGVIARIADSISPARDELLIEIGPGRAAVTMALLERGARIMAVEIDRDLAAMLAQRFADTGALTIHQGDALQTDFGKLAGGETYRLFGNLPYNISTALIFHVLQLRQAPIDMHFMLQREVVQRLAASPGSKRYGRLGVMCQNLCEVTPLFDVAPQAFEPRPGVYSAFVRLVQRDIPLSGVELLPKFDRIVKQAFSKRRKTLRNSLAGLTEPVQLESASINPNSRAEQLSLQQFIALARICSD